MKKSVIGVVMTFLIGLVVMTSLRSGPAEVSSTSTITTSTTSEPIQTTSSLADEVQQESVGAEKADASTVPSKPKPKPKTTLAPGPYCDRPPRPTDPGFPVTSPLRIEGASATWYMESNEFQASLYGLNPGDVRSWGMDFVASDDAKADYLRIAAGIRDSGFTIVSDEMRGNPDGTAGRFAGKYKNWTFGVTIINRRHITFSLLNWQTC